MVATDTECWERRGCATNRGYTKIGVGKRNVVMAHRAAWALANNAEPGEMLVCHTCDNRLCVNPDHLFLGTGLDNYQDMVAKGRLAPRTGPRNRKRGPKLTAEQAGEIRASSEPTAALAARYGVSKVLVFNIKAGNAWNDNARAVRRAASLLGQPLGTHCTKGS